MDALARWIAYDVIGNEMGHVEPLPIEARPLIARALVEDDRLGWPSIEEADAYLNAWAWA